MGISSSFGMARACLTATMFAVCLGIGAGSAGAQGVPPTAPSKPAPTKSATPAKDKAGKPADGTGQTPPAIGGEAPVNIRLRSLQQRVQALKERAWRAKARVGMLKEAVLGGGIGARTTITHQNDMGGSFRLIRLVYSLDGTQIFQRNDETGALHEQKKFEVVSGPIAPGSHTLTVVAEYKGHGYGVFEYMDKYRFKVRASHTFTASEGKALEIRVVGYEKGGASTPLEERPAIDFRVNTGNSGTK